jgi:hypothetical protein
MWEKLKTQYYSSKIFIDLQHENNAILCIRKKRKDRDGQKIPDLPLMPLLYAHNEDTS